MQTEKASFPCPSPGLLRLHIKLLLPTRNELRGYLHSAEKDAFGVSSKLSVHALNNAKLGYQCSGGISTDRWSSRSCLSSTGDGAPIKRSRAECVLGNAITSRILSAPVSNITNRSRP